MHALGQRTARGSVILMAVGLLVLLAMIGTTFIIIAYMDRKEAHAIATAAPAKRVANSIVGRIQATLLKDLWFNGTGASNCPYEAATSFLNQIDAAHYKIDPWLASTNVSTFTFSPTYAYFSDYDNTAKSAGTYRNLTNLNLSITTTSQFVDFRPADYPGRFTRPGMPDGPFKGGAYYIDTDSDSVPDAVVVDTGTRDRDGNQYWVAVRIVDLCGKVNVNTAFGPTEPPLPVTSPDGAVAPLTTGRVCGINVSDIDWNGDTSNTNLLRAANGLKFSISATEFHWNRSNSDDGTPISQSGYYTKYVCRAGCGETPRFIGDPLYRPFQADDLLGLLWLNTDPTSGSYTGRTWLAKALVCTQHPAPSPRYTAVPTAADINAFHEKRQYMTTWSGARILVPTYGVAADGTAIMQKYGRRADLNYDDFPALYDAFYAALPDPKVIIPVPYPGSPSGYTTPYLASGANVRKERAAQLAVNVLTYRHLYSNPKGKHPEVQTVDGITVYGVDRQPFITAIWQKRALTNSSTATPIQFSAVELFNPYTSPLDLAGGNSDATYNITVDGAPDACTWPASIAARSKLTIVSDDKVTAAGAKLLCPSLDLRKAVRINRVWGADQVCIGAVDPGDLPAVTATPDADLVAGAPPLLAARYRDDTAGYHRYTVAAYTDQKSTDADDAVDIDMDNGNATAKATSPLGQQTHNVAWLDPMNPLGYFDAGGIFQPVAPPGRRTFPNTPVYVRHGGFVSLGDMYRIFYTGPTKDVPLDRRLLDLLMAENDRAVSLNITSEAAHVGRLSPRTLLNAAGGPYSYGDLRIPPVAPGALISEFVTVTNPQLDGVDNNRRPGNRNAYNTALAEIDEDSEKTVYGVINLNTASKEVLMCLPYMTSAIANRIIQYRETVMAGTTSPHAYYGFSTVGEVTIPIMMSSGYPTLNPWPLCTATPGPTSGMDYYYPFNVTPVLAPNQGRNYAMGGPDDDDGLSTAVSTPPHYDFMKVLPVYSRFANVASVRSDTFAAYITVLRYPPTNIDMLNPTSIKRYVAVLDRSECYKRGGEPFTANLQTLNRDEVPNIILFGEMK